MLCGMLRRCLVWLTLCAHLFVTIGGTAVVLCEGADGHRAIELAHEPGGCDGGGHATEHEHAAGLAATPTGCHDTSLSLPESMLTRAEGKLPAVAAAMTPSERVWTEPTPTWFAFTSAASHNPPSHLHVVHTTILLI